MNYPLKQLSCPFCNTNNPKIRYRFEKCVILRCPDCDLMWLHPKPGPELLYEIYDLDYYFNKDFFLKDGSKLYGYVDYLAERINKQYMYRKIAIKVKNLLLQEDPSLASSQYNWFDVGCGFGFLMDVAFDNGFHVNGIEFSAAAVEYIRSKYTFPVMHGMLSEIEFSEKYNVISMFDVIEHLSDPFGDLKKLRQMIADNGYLLIQTMDSDSLVSRLLGKKLEDIRRIREHLFFFSKASIKNVLEHCGWHVYEIHSIGHTFQISLLMDRLLVNFSLLSKCANFLIYPKWLLDANVYINPRTKMLIVAQPKEI